MPDITFSGFILAACNVGATVAGTGYSIQTSGKKFQRGNNYGRYDDDNPSPSSNKVLRPTPPFSSSTFIKSSSDWATIPNAALR
jgi:predicted small secreted protein